MRVCVCVCERRDGEREKKIRISAADVRLLRNIQQRGVEEKERTD